MADELTSVTKEKFFGVIYALNLNVHPRIDLATLRGDIRSDWEFPNRTRFGVSIGDRYFLTPAYVTHASAL